MKSIVHMKNLILVILLVVSFNINGQSEKDTLFVGFITAPPFIIQNRPNLEGLNTWLWKRVANDLDLEFKLIPMQFSVMLDAINSGGIDLSIHSLAITNQCSMEMKFILCVKRHNCHIGSVFI